ncbi:MAG TPA: NDP-sugar synthase [Deltaproteobacteria bacterium]|nr:NDP-sugar synthase [Deltaproteobacteria bacterium]
MVAIILADGKSCKMKALTQDCPAPLIPLVDRPFIQHVVEYLVGNGFHELDIILDHLPEMIESLLEDGTRWGCRIRFHLLRKTSSIGKTIRLIHQRSGEETILLAEATKLPEVDLLQSRPVFGMNSPVLFCTSNDSKGSSQEWTGWAWLTLKCTLDLPDRCDKKGLELALLEKARHKKNTIPVSHCIDINTYKGILESHRIMLDKDFQGMLLRGKEVEEGIWLSRNVILHPTAKINPPVYIGRNCRIGKRVQLGPYASIGRNCVLDEHASAENAVVFPNTYVGEALELDNVIVDRNLLINIRLDSEALITDPFILSGMKDRQVRKWLSGVFSQAFACVLLLITLLFSPVIAIYARSLGSGRFMTKKMAVKLPASKDRTMWITYPLFGFHAGRDRKEHDKYTDTHGLKKSPGRQILDHFFSTFLPGLINVARGDLQIVGVEPRTPDEISLLDDEWREAYLKSKAGLITEAIINFGFDPSPHELYSAEMLYSRTFRKLSDLTLIGRYFRMVLSAAFSKNAEPAQETGSLP